MSSSKSKVASLVKSFDLHSKNEAKKSSESVSDSFVDVVKKKIDDCSGVLSSPQPAEPISINDDPEGAENTSPVTVICSDQSQEASNLTDRSALGNSRIQDGELGASVMSTASKMSEADKTELATTLTDPKRLWESYFSGLIESAAQAVNDNVEEVQAQLEHSLEVTNAIRRGEHRFAKVLHFPLKLILTPLKRGRRAANMFASMLEMQFGPLHAALQVGSVVLEWDDSSLVSPYLCAYEDQVMEMDMQPHSKWVRYTEKHYSKMKKSAEQLNYPDQIEYIYAVTAEKKKIIDALIDVVVQYNKHYYYHPIFRNCQHFVCDALETLQVQIPKELPGGLGKYYKALVQGRTPSVPDKFKTHSDLDAYVMQKQKDGALPDMPQHDLEYLLALYFRFHVESKTQLRKDRKALEEWQCKQRSCCMGDVEKLIRVESMKLHNFKTIS